MSLAHDYVLDRAPRTRPAPAVFSLVGAVRSYGRDQEIFGEGESADFVYTVLSGAVRCFRILGDGRRQISGFYLPSDIFGLETGCTHHVTAEAIGRTTARVSRWTALADAEDGEHRLCRTLAAELRRAQDHIITLGRRGATERVGAFLIDLAERIGEAETVELPMTRQDVADYLGLTIETVSRTLTHLREEGFIRLRGLRDIELKRRGALAQLTE
ncbi:MAG TPA: helix-turn-helix domain-containing protein [Caulobacteraceae bacterium]|nr:helix-turn-helix domain-containing protein [Caulobacteraceae bacterium]